MSQTTSEKLSCGFVNGAGTADACTEALESEGYEVECIETSGDGYQMLVTCDLEDDATLALASGIVRGVCHLMKTLTEEGVL
jgi:hypothetical protein